MGVVEASEDEIRRIGVFFGAHAFLNALRAEVPAPSKRRMKVYARHWIEFETPRGCMKCIDLP